MKRGLKAAHPAEYRSWAMMKTRCTNPNADRYPHYGGRGIRVCTRWQTFANFWDDMGPRPTVEHSIGRIDNDADYSPENCRWETRAEQARNTSANIWLELNGERMILQDWAARTGLSRLGIQARLRRGWTVERALTVPCGSLRTPKKQDGSANSMAKLNEDKVRQIRALCRAGNKQARIASDFGVSVMTISLIANNKTWRHVA